jgi:hypothetical protein
MLFKDSLASSASMLEQVDSKRSTLKMVPSRPLAASLADRQAIN